MRAYAWKGLWPVLLGLAVAVFHLPTAHAGRFEELDERVSRLERLLENRVLSEMLREMEELRREVRELRGELEVHGHEIRTLQEQQRELYSDADRRLSRVEEGTVPDRPPALPPPRPSTEPPVPQVEGAPAVEADPAAEQAAYERAFNLLTEGRYQEAEQGFRQFLQGYPAGQYADNAQYWLGEVYYLTRDFDQALVEFTTVLERFPRSSKRPNALLKVGFIHYEKGDWRKAKEFLNRVLEEYPGGSAARLATNRLQQIAREGH